MYSEGRQPGCIAEHLEGMSVQERSGFERVVWAPDPEDGFVLGDLVDIGSNTLTVNRKDGKGQIVAKHDEVFPSEDDLQKTVEDNCALMYLNEGTLLHNCKKRYENMNIYSYVANILIAINPYEQLPTLYSDETIAKYNGKSLGQLPPHIYAIADKAYREMRRSGESQSIIVSGESGAGKTESQKAVLKYLCQNWGTHAGPIQQRILETNPILESFGNARTSRNNNSSRFGKFVEIHFDKKHEVAGGFVSHYLLEKSRLCTQNVGERNYHIFYQLIAGADKELYRQLGLASPDKFNYLRKGCTQFFCPAGQESKIPADRLPADNVFLRDDVVNDAADFDHLLQCLSKCGMTHENIQDVLRIVASVLHLGNIGFVENVDDSKGGCKVDSASAMAVTEAARLMGVEEQGLKMSLTSRAMQPTRGGVKGTLILVPLKPGEACAARDALAKAIYSHLFDWVVSAINKSIPFTNSNTYIGVLDIAGFEFFGKNSFEQFCINYCNEKLQHFFNERILKQEQELYEKEGLFVEKIEFADNQDCIDVFEKKTSGMLDLLDEEMRLPRPSPQHFTSQVHQHHAAHFRIDTPRKSKLRQHRDMRDEDGVLVRHFAGTVCYQTGEFLEKNNDALHASLEAFLHSSSVNLIQDVFASQAAVEVAAPAAKRPMGKLQAASVGSKFRQQLTTLLGKLNDTGTHFVRCVKPNGEMQRWGWNGATILSQLKCAGMGSVLRLMQKGYPSRTSFSDLYDMYASVLPPELSRLDPRLFCKCLFRVLGLNSKDFCFGMTKVFFRSGKFAQFDQLLRQEPAHMLSLVKKVKSWLIGVRWRKSQYGAWSVIKLKNKIQYRRKKIETVQRFARGYIIRKQVRPRLALYRKATALHMRSGEMQKIVESLSTKSRDQWEREVADTQKNLQHLVQLCKTKEMDIDAAARNYEECLKKVDMVIESLRNQMETDEVERLADIERRMKDEQEREERERAEQIETERTRQEHERMRRLLEEERVRAEEEHKKRVDEERENEQREKVHEEERRAREERERLDHALAVRIASESNMSVDPQPPSTSMSSSASSGNNNTNGGSKYDLSSWKYAELRDTINNCTDMELLLACKDEFHRRLRIYNEWKQRNASSQTKEKNENQRIPVGLATNTTVKVSIAPQVNPALTAQRFFKVPFTRNTSGNKNPSGFKLEKGSQNGVWYGHFNGQWIQRQIELHPDKSPLLLVAGKDDMQMCELPLDQTELPRRKGAEILQHEFETVWTHLGGKPMNRWNP